MKSFKGRQNKNYKKELSRLLSIDNIIQTALPIKINDDKDGKIARLDFWGLSGTSLLDISKTFTDGIIANEFENIFTHLNILNEKGINIKVRFLFSYLFSDFVFNIIEAEKTQNRASINDTIHKINFNIDSEISEEEFYSSNIFRNQNNSLKQIQRLIEKYNLISSPYNTIRVRFTPIPINFCGLIINEFAVFDSYSYSKKEKLSEQLSYSMPILAVNKYKDGEVFNEIEDHFRYLWNHETTIFCEDATHFDINKPLSLTKFRKPNEIKLIAKAKKIIEVSKKYEKEDISEDISETIINSWNFRLLNKIISNTRIFQKFPSKESIFIACCWEETEDKSFNPNSIAKTISELTKECFEKSSDSIATLLVEPNPGSELSEKIFTSLKQATLAIIILTKDVETKNGEFFPSLNVVHELGFMMNHLRARETGRVLILKEKGVKLPSNVGNYEFVEIEKDKFILRFFDIIEWLYARCGTLTNSNIIKALNIYKNKLETFRDKGVILPKEFNEVTRKISAHHKQYNKNSKSV